MPYNTSMNMHFPSQYLNSRLRDRFRGEILPPLRIASWNVDNLCESPDDAHFRLENAGFSITHYLGSPHIIALQELSGEAHTDRKPSSAAYNAKRLIEAIARAGGPLYCYTEVPSTRYEGGKPEAHIRNGFLYRPDRVFLSNMHESTPAMTGTANPAHISPDDSAFFESRPPLVARFTDRDTQEHYTIVNLHLCSDGGFSRARKGGNTPLADALWQPNTERLQQRISQAEIVSTYLASLTGHKIVLGDLNTGTAVTINNKQSSQGPNEVLNILGRAGLVDVAKPFSLPPSVEHITPQGLRRMTLDYVFTSPELAKRIHNVQRPALNHIPASDEPKESRLSDHNPLVISVAPPLRVQKFQRGGRG